MSSAVHPLHHRARGAIVAAVAPLLVALASLLGLLAAPAPAQAAFTLTTDPDYAVTQAGANCFLGSSDNNGIYYLACGTRIQRYDRFGVRLADIMIPAGVVGTRDVAPSPDGTYLYVSQGTTAPRRLNRTATGTYVLDAAWAMQQFSVWNVPWTPVGHAIATDGRGDIYVSSGSYWVKGTQNSIAKYAPDGTWITAFGDFGKENGNWITNQDLAVSRDGRRVWVGENCGRSCIYTSPDYDASRVTRYDFNPGGKYRFTRVITSHGPMDGNPFPRCTSDGAAHSAYSLTLDFAETLYVTSTTCGRIQVFDTDADPANDRFVRTIATYIDPATAGGIDGLNNHYLSSDWAGRLTASEWVRKFTPKTISLPELPLPPLEPLPEPDIEAPVVTNLTLPATTTTQEIAVTTTATDNRGVTELQLAREDGTWGPWQPFASPVTYRLSDNFGIKGVYVRVRDMAGNASPAVYRTLSFTAPAAPDEPPPPVGDVADPVLTAVTIPALTPTALIQVSVTATDDVGLRWVRFANEDGNWSAWRAFAATSEWTLSAGQGAKAVYAQVRDGAGRDSTVLLARTKVAWDAPAPDPGAGGGGGAPDATAPVLSSLTIPGETTTQEITATLAATDDVAVAQVRFANEDGNWTGWQAWAPTKQWLLTAAWGGKLVYAQVRDAAGNESLVLSARTSYVKTAAGPVDAAAPQLTSVTIPNPTPTADVTVTLQATDDIAVTQVRFANEDGTWQAWKAYAGEVPHSLTAGTGLKAVYAQVRDAAGRESNVLFVRTLVAA